MGDNNNSGHAVQSPSGPFAGHSDMTSSTHCPIFLRGPKGPLAARRGSVDDAYLPALVPQDRVDLRIGAVARASLRPQIRGF